MSGELVELGDLLIVMTSEDIKKVGIVVLFSAALYSCQVAYKFNIVFRSAVLYWPALYRS
jgi:hypothetical protein